MTNSTVVFAGAGDLAQRAIQYLADAPVDCWTVSRSQKTFGQAQSIVGDLTAAETLASISACKPKVIVITLVPNGAGEQGYLKGYIEPLRALIEKAQHWATPPFLIFASSTGVYHQSEGEWVNEESPTLPSAYSGRCMLQAEQLLASSGLPFCCVRFGGIYGPGRDFLIQQVKAGKGGSAEYTNRIHQDDASQVLSFLVESYLTEKPIPPIIVACDSEPVSSQQVREYIAGQLGLDLSHLHPSDSGRGGNKRCSNRLLLSLGFQFKFADYREGYLNCGQ